MRLIGNPYLHGATTAIAGMAHFAGEGPFGATCGGCLYVDPKSRRRTKADGLVGKCRQYSALMHRVGPAFPLNTPACKYFEPRDEHRVTTADSRRDR